MAHLKTFNKDRLNMVWDRDEDGSHSAAFQLDGHPIAEVKSDQCCTKVAVALNIQKTVSNEDIGQIITLLWSVQGFATSLREGSERLWTL